MTDMYFEIGDTVRLVVDVFLCSDGTVSDDQPAYDEDFVENLNGDLFKIVDVREKLFGYTLSAVDKPYKCEEFDVFIREIELISRGNPPMNLVWG